MEEEYERSKEKQLIEDIELLKKQYIDEKLSINYAKSSHLWMINLYSSKLPEKICLLKDEVDEFNGYMENFDCNFPNKIIIKITVIYIGKDQYDEELIFSNKNGSAEYEEFVKDLGHHICKEGIKNITSTNPGIFYYSTPINSIFQLGN